MSGSSGNSDSQKSSKTPQFSPAPAPFFASESTEKLPISMQSSRNTSPERPLHPPSGSPGKATSRTSLIEPVAMADSLFGGDSSVGNDSFFLPDPALPQSSALPKNPATKSLDPYSKSPDSGTKLQFPGSPPSKSTVVPQAVDLPAADALFGTPAKSNDFFSAVSHQEPQNSAMGVSTSLPVANQASIVADPSYSGYGGTVPDYSQGFSHDGTGVTDNVPQYGYPASSTFDGGISNGSYDYASGYTNGTTDVSANPYNYSSMPSDVPNQTGNTNEYSSNTYAPSYPYGTTTDTGSSNMYQYNYTGENSTASAGDSVGIQDTGSSNTYQYNYTGENGTTHIGDSVDAQNTGSYQYNYTGENGTANMDNTSVTQPDTNAGLYNSNAGYPYPSYDYSSAPDYSNGLTQSFTQPQASNVPNGVESTVNEPSGLNTDSNSFPPNLNQPETVEQSISNKFNENQGNSTKSSPLNQTAKEPVAQILDSMTSNMNSASIISRNTMEYDSKNQKTVEDIPEFDDLVQESKQLFNSGPPTTEWNSKTIPPPIDSHNSSKTQLANSKILSPTSTTSSTHGSSVPISSGSGSVTPKATAIQSFSFPATSVSDSGLNQQSRTESAIQELVNTTSKISVNPSTKNSDQSKLTKSPPVPPPTVLSQSTKPLAASYAPDDDHTSIISTMTSVSRAPSRTSGKACPSCSKLNDFDSNFCSKCGSPLGPALPSDRAAQHYEHSNPVSTIPSRMMSPETTSLKRNASLPSQFNDPLYQTPYYSDINRWKQQYGTGSTINLDNDPLMRRGAPLVHFGFGGKLVVMFTRRQSRFSNSGSTERIYHGMIHIHSTQKLLHYHKPHDVNEWTRFHGPLFKAKKKDVTKWIDEKLNDAEQKQLSSSDPDRILLYRLLKAFLESDGKLLQNPDAHQKILREIFKIPDQPQTSNSNLPAVDQKPATGNLETIRSYLIHGKRQEAVQYATESGLWTHALVLASFTGKDTYQAVLQKFTNQFISNRDPLYAFYLLLGGKLTNDMSLFPNSDQVLEEWKNHVAILLSNRTNGDIQALVQLADHLAVHRRVSASQIIYLLAGLPIDGLDSSDGKTVLLGISHILHPLIFHQNSSALLMTECYEYAIRLQNSQLLLPHLQAYKLLHACLLADIGCMEEAYKYTESIFELSKTYTKGSPYFHRQFVLVLKQLHERLIGSGTGVSSSETSSWLPKMPIQGIFDAFDRGLNKFMGVSEPAPAKPATTASKRSSSVSVASRYSSGESSFNTAATSVPPPANGYTPGYVSSNASSNYPASGANNSYPSQPDPYVGNQNAIASSSGYGQAPVYSDNPYGYVPTSSGPSPKKSQAPSYDPNSAPSGHQYNSTYGPTPTPISASQDPNYTSNYGAPTPSQNPNYTSNYGAPTPVQYPSGNDGQTGYNPYSQPGDYGSYGQTSYSENTPTYGGNVQSNNTTTGNELAEEDLGFGNNSLKRKSTISTTGQTPPAQPDSKAKQPEEEGTRTEISQTSYMAIITGLFRRTSSSNSNAAATPEKKGTRANLGKPNEFKYDPVLKKWVNPDAKDDNQSTTPAAPPTDSQLGPSYSRPPTAPPTTPTIMSTTTSRANSPAPFHVGGAGIPGVVNPVGTAPLDPTAMMGTTPGLAKRGTLRRNARSRYVDTLNPNAAATDGNSTQLPGDPMRSQSAAGFLPQPPAAASFGTVDLPNPMASGGSIPRIMTPANMQRRDTQSSTTSTGSHNPNPPVPSDPYQQPYGQPYSQNPPPPYPYSQ